MNDVNRDGRLDLEIYNDAISGNGQNSTYDVFINQKDYFELNREFSLPNLKYENESGVFISRSSGGGGNYTKTTFKFNNEILKPIHIETREYDKKRKEYVITKRELN